MAVAGVDAAFSELHPPTSERIERETARPSNPSAPERTSDAYAIRRRTPRRSLIVVLPENHVVSPEAVSAHLPAEGDPEAMDVIVACAGQPTSLAALQRRIRDLQILLAPAGTSGEDLREIAMNQAPGDIVTLMSGTPS